MADLPQRSSPTIDAIWKHYEDNQERGWRDHLGCSLIGAPCTRAIWSSWRWVTDKRHAGRILRLFKTGHMAEPRIASDLRNVGVNIMTVDPETGKQWTCRDETGHFGGSADGVGIGFLEAPATWHLVEVKTHSAKSFESLKKDGVAVSKPQHEAQMQSYMHLLGLERAAYVSVNKDTDDLYLERVRYDAESALRLVAKAHRIIASAEPPTRISEDPSWWQCRFCDHAAVCHEGKMPATNCRTCARSTPVEAGQWCCERTGKLIPVDQQRKGCGDHIFIPALIRDEQVDAAEDGSWVEYRRTDGSLWRDGIPF